MSGKIRNLKASHLFSSICRHLSVFPDFGFRAWAFLRISTFSLRLLPRAALLFTGLAAIAADTSDPADLPASSLRPPRDEILPSFWEQYGTLIILGAVLILALAALAGWLLTRPKPQVQVPFGVQARIELEPLRQNPEDGPLLSRTSQILRRYLAAMFGLPPGELTTSEFCRMVLSDPKIGAELGRETSEFLQACDLSKFSPSPPGLPPGVVNRALDLIDRADKRLAESNRVAATPASHSGPHPPPLPRQPNELPSSA